MSFHVDDNDIETKWDGRTVWISRAGDTIGRFGVMGIDIHNTWDAQLSGSPQCLNCTHSLTTTADWYRFVGLMRTLHNVEVPGAAKPIRFQEV